MPRPLYECAVCGLKFHTLADRRGHWKEDKNARMCAPRYALPALGYRHVRGAWARGRVS